MKIRDYRIIEWIGLEGNLNIIRFHPCAHQIRLPRALCSLALGNSRDRVPTALWAACACKQTSQGGRLSEALMICVENVMPSSGSGVVKLQQHETQQAANLSCLVSGLGSLL